MKRLLSILICVCSVGCAARAVPPPAVATESLRADRLVDAGCYACLQEAFAIYQAEAPRSPAAIRKAFSTALLLVVREKELGLSAARWIESASALARSNDRAYLDIVAAIPWESAGVADFSHTRITSVVTLRRWSAYLEATSFHPTLDRYLFLTLACRTPALRPQDEAALTAYAAESPLLRYRVGLCGAHRRDDLTAVLQGDARFAEAAFFLGRYEIGSAYNNRDWVRRAVPLLRQAHGAFPQAALVTVTLASVLRTKNDLPGALALYDEALALVPEQRDALLGKLITLTYLERPGAAIAVATTLLDLGTWYLGDAYYWRAWNHYLQRDIETAVSDIASAKKLVQNSDVLTLSGRLAYDQARREDARRDLVQARRFNGDNCIATWYLGLIEGDASAWAESVREFTTAADCYQRESEGLRKEAADLAADLDPADLEVQSADLERRIEESVLQMARSWYNAAQASIRVGARTQALDHARRAATHPVLKERADKLVQVLERP